MENEPWLAAHPSRKTWSRHTRHGTAKRARARPGRRHPVQRPHHPRHARPASLIHPRSRKSSSLRNRACVRSALRCGLRHVIPRLSHPGPNHIVRQCSPRPRDIARVLSTQRRARPVTRLHLPSTHCRRRHRARRSTASVCRLACCMRRRLAASRRSSREMSREQEAAAHVQAPMVSLLTAQPSGAVGILERNRIAWIRTRHRAQRTRKPAEQLLERQALQLQRRRARQSGRACPCRRPRRPRRRS